MVTENTDDTPAADADVAAAAGIPEDTPSSDAVAEQPVAEVTPSSEAPAAPAAEPAPVTPPVPEQPAIDPAVAQRAIERNAILERQIADATLNTQVAEYEQTLVSQGHTPEVAQQIAGVQKQAFQAQNQLQEQYQQNIETERGRFRAAVQIGKEFGVNPEELIEFVDDKAMRTHAGVVKKMADMSSEIAGMKREKGPPTQEFEAGAGDPVVVSSNGKDLDRYNNGANDKAALDAGREAAGG